MVRVKSIWPPLPVPKEEWIIIDEDPDTPCVKVLHPAGFQGEMYYKLTKFMGRWKYILEPEIVLELPPCLFGVAEVPYP